MTRNPPDNVRIPTALYRCDYHQQCHTEPVPANWLYWVPKVKKWVCKNCVTQIASSDDGQQLYFCLEGVLSTKARRERDKP